MIQRIQTLYLTLTIILALLFLSGSFFSFSDGSGRLIESTISGLIMASEDAASSSLHNTLPISVLVFLIVLSSLITIFIYKNRKIQKWLALSIIVMTSILIMTSIYCIWFVTNEYDARLVPGYKLVLPVAMLLFSILAYRGIRNDDRLVKSYDRLR